jgi:hypothetical protein
VRRLRCRAAHRPRLAWQGDRACRPGGQSAFAARAATHLTRRLRLSRVCSPGRVARTGSLHARRGRSSNRRCLSVYRLAIPAFSLRAPVHARHLSACFARARRRPVGSQAGGCREQPRSRGPYRERGTHDGALGEGGSRVRRLESCAAGACRRRRAQRHARAVDLGRSAGARCSQNRHASRARGGHRRFDEPRGPPGNSRFARRRDRREGLRRAPAPVRGACPHAMGGASARGGERARRPRATRGRGDCRLWDACLWLPGRLGRAAAADRHSQPAGGDGPMGWPRGFAGVVARPVRRRLPGCAGADALAHGARGRMAGDGRLGHPRSAAVDRLATALVCGMGAAAGRARR